MLRCGGAVVRGAGTAAAPSPSADELSAFRGEHGQVWGRLRCCSMPLEAQQQRAPILPLGGEKGKQRGQPDAEGDGPGEYAYGFALEGAGGARIRLISAKPVPIMWLGTDVIVEEPVLVKSVRTGSAAYLEVAELRPAHCLPHGDAAKQPNQQEHVAMIVMAKSPIIMTKSGKKFFMVQLRQSQLSGADGPEIGHSPRRVKARHSYGFTHLFIQSEQLLCWHPFLVIGHEYLFPRLRRRQFGNSDRRVLVPEDGCTPHSLVARCAGSPPRSVPLPTAGTVHYVGVISRVAPLGLRGLYELDGPEKLKIFFQLYPCSEFGAGLRAGARVRLWHMHPVYLWGRLQGYGACLHSSYHVDSFSCEANAPYVPLRWCKPSPLVQASRAPVLAPDLLHTLILFDDILAQIAWSYHFRKAVSKKWHSKWSDLKGIAKSLELWLANILGQSQRVTSMARRDMASEFIFHGDQICSADSTNLSESTVPHTLEGPKLLWPGSSATVPSLYPRLPYIAEILHEVRSLTQAETPSSDGSMKWVRHTDQGGSSVLIGWLRLWPGPPPRLWLCDATSRLEVLLTTPCSDGKGASAVLQLAVAKFLEQGKLAVTCFEDDQAQPSKCFWALGCDEGCPCGNGLFASLERKEQAACMIDSFDILTELPSGNAQPRHYIVADYRRVHTKSGAPAAMENVSAGRNNVSSVTRALCCKNWASAKESLLSVQGVVRCIGLRQQKPGERFKLAGEREYRSPCELQPSGALLWDQQLCIELQGIDSNDSVMIYTDCGLGGLQWPLGMVPGCAVVRISGLQRRHKQERSIYLSSKYDHSPHTYLSVSMLQNPAPQAGLWVSNSALPMNFCASRDDKDVDVAVPSARIDDAAAQRHDTMSQLYQMTEISRAMLRLSVTIMDIDSVTLYFTPERNGPQWEVVAVVDDGSGSATLCADGDAAVDLLQLSPTNRQMIEDEVAGSSGRMLQLHPSARLRHEEGSSKSRATLERAALTSANGSRRIIACHELPQKSSATTVTLDMGREQLATVCPVRHRLRACKVESLNCQSEAYSVLSRVKALLGNS